MESFKTAIDMVNDLHLDIIIDYDGLHDFNSVKYLTRIDDSIMITWLGYAGTTGSGTIPRRVSHLSSIQAVNAANYILADGVVLPPDMLHTQYYSEKIIYLPGSYQPQDEHKGKGLYDESSMDDIKTIADDSIIDRSQSRLKFLQKIYANDTNAYPTDAEHYSWLICFNRLSKITPDAFKSWMQILLQNPKSLLILMIRSLTSTDNIKV
jgi:predicted O-linked N-acetylglucosamine transferase (SPINDLY family)